MKILMTPNEKTLAIIGEQPVFANKDYRFMKYCLVKDFPDGKIIYNALTSSMVILEHEEISEIGNINKYAFLYKNYFLVPEDFDEMKVTNIIMNNLRSPIDDLYLNNPTTFTILTTTKCNARCFYCYELNKKNKKHMSDETAYKIADYIHTYAPENSIVNLNFFGGEPLFNQKPIDIIVNKLFDYGRNIRSEVTSNGYLFTKELIIKAKNIWNLQNVQITLDGTESIYNKTKNYIYKDNVSPYKRVLNNIAILLNYGISVILRFNIDLYNADDLKKLVIEIYNRFGNHPNLSMYAWPIFEDEKNIKTPEEHIKVFEVLKELENTMEKCGYFYGYLPPSQPKIYQCMADDGQSVIIDPSGNLGTCEHFIDSHFWGHIDNPIKKNFNELNIWREYEAPLDICNDCPLYPICNRPSYCEEMSKCDEQYKEWRIRRYLNGLDQIYKNINGDNNILPYRLAENVY
jgi:radical SAM protein with 4Fe4S-binding SPASM domain